MSDGASARTRNPVGWGTLEERVTDAERRVLARAVVALVGRSDLETKLPPAPEEVLLPEPRVAVPEHLSRFTTTAHQERLLRAVGRSFRDLAQLRMRRVPHAPDAVVTPRDLLELCAALEWADQANLAIIPYGGGTSVVGGVNAEVPSGFAGVVTVDLQHLDKVLDINLTDRVVAAQAGILGPALDAALKPYGLSARHYPQSYMHSTLGGWVATRSAGHFSTGIPKIEDRVQALDVLLANGKSLQTRPLPAGSAGPDPNRMWAGSEGAFGIITAVRLRVVPTPRYRRMAGVLFKRFEDGLLAVRHIAQSGLWPAHLRLLDPYEHAVSAMLQGKRGHTEAYLILGFESEAAPVDGRLKAALHMAYDCGGRPEPPSGDVSQAEPDGAAAWRRSFFRQPYLRDAMLDWAVVTDTLETAVPYSRAEGLYREVREATLEALQSACGGGGVLCRTTHAYPDGVALYFSFYGRGRHGGLIDAWCEVKAAASDAVEAAGGTISHHHAMGRDHKPWAERELPEPFLRAMAAARRSFDPAGRMNPGLWFEDSGQPKERQSREVTEEYEL